MQEDHLLIINQVEITPLAHRTAIEKLIKSFLNSRFNRVPQAHNKHTDTLATLASKFMTGQLK